MAARTRSRDTVPATKSVVAPHNYTFYKRRKVYDAWPAYHWEDAVDPYSLSLLYKNGETESITDRVGEWGFCPVTHTKDGGIPMKGLNFSVGTLPPDNYFPNLQWKTWKVECQLPDINWIHWKSQSNGLPSGGTPGGIDWDSLVSSVGSSLDGSMKAGTNMLVNLAEVAQTIGMIKNPFNARGLAKLGRNTMSLRKLAKTSANAWLEYRYGWSNLYRDIKALAQMYQKMKQHIEYLEKTRNEWASLAASQRNSGVTNAWYGGSNINDGYTSYTFQPCDVIRTGTFSLDIKRLEAMDKWTKLHYAIQYTGVDEVLVALWDLVPFSFVIDWFIGVDQMLGRRPINWTQFSLRNIGYSEKLTYSCAIKRQTYMATSFESGYYAVATTGKVDISKQYVRTPGFPPGSFGAGFFGSLSTYQLADAAALVVQRL